MNNPNEKQPAFPCFPIQDQFQRLIAPIPGMSKLEYYSLHILAASGGALLPFAAINLAKELIKAIDECEKSEDQNTLQIIK
jgi:hypothetical protein